MLRMTKQSKENGETIECCQGTRNNLPLYERR